MPKKQTYNRKDVEGYIKFLKKRIESKNFNKNATKEEIEKTKLKLAKEKLRLRFMTPA